MFYFTSHRILCFTRKEFWFFDGERINEGTYNVFIASQKIKRPGICFLQQYPTTIIDLTKESSEIYSAIHPTYRYDIRKAEEHNFQFLTFLNASLDDCIQLTNTYRRFAKRKGLEPYSKSRILALWRTGKILFTKILEGNNVIVTHVYIYDNNTIFLSNSFHDPDFTDQRLRSEANKLLHWKDILLFKKMNFYHYDFGGINMDKLPGITKFKLNFGGKIEMNYRYIKTSLFIFLIVKAKKIILTKMLRFKLN